MHKAPFEIINYTDNYRTQVLSVWEYLTFYQKFGFEIFERSATDEQGKPYPILKMQLAKKEVCPKSH